VLKEIVSYSSICIAPLNGRGPTEAPLVRLASRKETSFKFSDKEVERLDDKKEARADGGKRFQREGPATEKDLDLAIVVLDDMMMMMSSM